MGRDKDSGKRTSALDSILNAAQRLFVENGFEAVSVRDITQAARVNVAAINYHFGSKDALCAAVLMRFFGPLIEERQRRLTELEDRYSARGKLIPITDLLDSWLEPFFTRYFEEPGWGQATYALEEQLIRSPEVERALARYTSASAYVDAFTHALARTCKHLSKAETQFRYGCMIGMVTSIFRDPNWSAQSQRAAAAARSPAWLKRQTRDAAQILFSH